MLTDILDKIMFLKVFYYGTKAAVILRASLTNQIVI
jgi:hypothetical protein